MTQLTREYFENHPQWEIVTYEHVDKDFPDFVLWSAKLQMREDNFVELSITNSIYEWRFCMNGEINGKKEGFFQGFIYFTTVEELETFFKLVHFDNYQYSLDIKF